MSLKKEKPAPSVWETPFIQSIIKLIDTLNIRDSNTSSEDHLTKSMEIKQTCLELFKSFINNRQYAGIQRNAIKALLLLDENFAIISLQEKYNQESDYLSALFTHTSVDLNENSYTFDGIKLSKESFNILVSILQKTLQNTYTK